MRTPKQIAASRAKGARSKAPITAQGKRNSSRNGIRHGLLAKAVLLKDEHTGRFIDLLNDLIAKHLGGAAKSGACKKQTSITTTLLTSTPTALSAVLSVRNSSIRAQEVLLCNEVAFDRRIIRSLYRLQQIQEKRAAARAAPRTPATEICRCGTNRNCILDKPTTKCDDYVWKPQLSNLISAIPTKRVSI